MDLSGSQMKALHKALLSAFPRRGDLQRMVLFGLEENLESIAGAGPLDEVVLNLITWTRGRGRLDELVEAALEANSTNPELLAFSQSVELPDQQVATEPGKTSIPPPNIIVEGDYIQGNKTTGDSIEVGDITNSQGIAIGRSSSASVGQGQAEPARRSSSGGQDPEVADLYQQLADQFNLAELQDLSFGLGVDFEDLGGTGRKAKARELVQYMQRRGRLDQLSRAMQERD